MITAAKTICLLSLAVFLGFLSYLAWTATRVVDQVGAQVTVLSGRVDKVLDQANTQLAGFATTENNLNAILSSSRTAVNTLNGSLQTLNRPCGGGHPCGTLADVAKTLGTIRGTFWQIEVAANHENKNLGTLDTQEAQAFADFHQSMQNLNTDEIQLSASLESLDGILSSPDLTGLIKNSNTTMYNLGQTTGDLQAKLHPILNPPPCVGRFCFVKKVWPYVRTGSHLAEPAYWGSQLFNALK